MAWWRRRQIDHRRPWVRVCPLRRSRWRSLRISASVSGIRRRCIGAASWFAGLGRWGCVAATSSGSMRGDGEEGVGEHGECDVAVPCVPGADLVVVEAGFVLARSEAFFDRPAGAGYLHDFAESGLVRVVASVEREFSVVEGASDEVLPVPFGRDDPCPVVDSVPLCSDAAGTTLTYVGRQALRVAFDLVGVAGGVEERSVLRYPHHVGEPIVFQVCAQAGALAELLVGGEPGERDLGGPGTLDHLADLLGPGCEGDLGRDAGLGAALGVGHP